MKTCFGPSPHLILIGRLATNQVEAAGNTLQEVVEVMGNAAGQLAEGIHFLRLTELLLGERLLGDITAKAVEASALRYGRPGNDAPLAILMKKPELVFDNGFSFEQSRHAGGSGLAV